ncbi:hypothetical protein ACFUNF_41265, partial [Streptomyces sp. NPDC057291]|uniref:hypothetical protein n=1 Tax=Streptomyces sp. NPDC057291 TaxID=3346087 RepID=UPI0036432520
LEHRARRRSVSRLVHRKNRQIEAHGIIFHLAMWERLAGRTLPDAAHAILIVWEPATCLLVFGDAGLTGSARDQNLGDYARARCQ